MKNTALISVVIVAVAIAAAAIYFFRRTRDASRYQSETGMQERIELKTKDNFSIAGDYYAPSSASSRGLLLLHMMPAARSSWRALAGKMQTAGFHVLAIDLRGHGESQYGPNGYRDFSDVEHQASKFDVEAAAEFLKSKGAAQLFLGGASIGANLSLQHLAEHPEAGAAFLLSPGLDYRGVKTESFAKRLRSDQAVYFAASAEDMRSSGQSAADMAETLYGLCACRKELKKFDNAGHGTTIFEREPAFMDIIVSWLKGL